MARGDGTCWPGHAFFYYWRRGNFAAFLNKSYYVFLLLETVGGPLVARPRVFILLEAIQKKMLASAKSWRRYNENILHSKKTR